MAGSGRPAGSASAPIHPIEPPGVRPPIGRPPGARPPIARPPTGARRFITGLLFFIPVFVLTLGLWHAYNLGRQVAAPVREVVDVQTALGFILLNLLAIIFVALLILLMGFVAEFGFVARRVDRLDRALHAILPGYGMAKGIVGGVVKEDTLVAKLRPVMVPFGQGRRLGFEVERTDSLSTVYLPNAPTARSGSVSVYPAELVTQLDIPPHKTLEILSFHGRGLAAVLAKHPGS